MPAGGVWRRALWRLSRGSWTRRVPGRAIWLAATRRIDLEAQLGPLSGALGVLQCAAAAAHLESDATGNVVATAGGPRHDAAAALLLTP